MSKKPRGMLMSPSSTGGSTGGGDRSKRPTGEAYPAVGSSVEEKKERDPQECRIEPERPMEVVFTQDTFRKLIAWTLGPLLTLLVGAVSAFFYFYHSTNSHMTDPTIHLNRGERIKFETKEEAKAERKKLKHEIKSHIDVKVREIKVGQKEQLQESLDKITKQNEKQFKKLVREIRR
jgi:hypothetical protein